MHDAGAKPAHADAAIADATEAEAGSTDALLGPGGDAAVSPDVGTSADAGSTPVSIANGSFSPSLGEARNTLHAVIGRVPSSGAAGTSSGAAHRLRGLSTPSK
jgi:hypothetical protein